MFFAIFGYERGAFTGAAARKLGKFETANGGTLFLDEIGDLELYLQPKLLRVLEYGTFERLGGTETMHVDVRLIAATSQPLEELIEQDKFRADLYDRLNVVPIVIPPLRDRRSDIPLLVKHYLNDGVMVDDAAMEFLMRCQWPGNVRELKTTVERLSVLQEGGVITVHDLLMRTKIKPDETTEGEYTLVMVRDDLEGLRAEVAGYRGDLTRVLQQLPADINGYVDQLRELSEAVTALSGKIGRLEEASLQGQKSLERELYRLRYTSGIEDFRDEEGNPVYSKNGFWVTMTHNPDIFQDKPRWRLVQFLDYVTSGSASTNKSAAIRAIETMYPQEVKLYSNQKEGAGKPTITSSPEHQYRANSVHSPKPA